MVHNIGIRETLGLIIVVKAFMEVMLPSANQ